MAVEHTAVWLLSPEAKVVVNTLCHTLLLMVTDFLENTQQRLLYMPRWAEPRGIRLCVCVCVSVCVCVCECVCVCLAVCVYVVRAHFSATAKN